MILEGFPELAREVGGLGIFELGPAELDRLGSGLLFLLARFLGEMGGLLGYLPLPEPVGWGIAGPPGGGSGALEGLDEVVQGLLEGGGGEAGSLEIAEVVLLGLGLSFRLPLLIGKESLPGGEGLLLGKGLLGGGIHFGSWVLTVCRIWLRIGTYCEAKNDEDIASGLGLGGV